MKLIITKFLAKCFVNTSNKKIFSPTNFAAVRKNSMEKFNMNNLK